MATFDPYHKWLGIPLADQPANHYRLLGLNLFEADPDVIDAATEQRVSYLRQCATGQHIAESQNLLNEVAAARLCLLCATTKHAYDDELLQLSRKLGSDEAKTVQLASQAASNPKQYVAVIVLLAVSVWLWNLSPQKNDNSDRSARTQSSVLIVERSDSGAERERKSFLFAGTRAGEERSDNVLNMKLIWCPPGSFLMGSPMRDASWKEDENQVQITLRSGFWLGKFEVTQDEWRQMMGTTVAFQKAKPNCNGRLNGIGGRYPMYFVNYDEALAFCAKFTVQERQSKRLSERCEYRLPTEAQWEYACRAGSQSRFSFGDNDADLDKSAWYSKNSRFSSHPVGMKRPNLWGLCEMHGNVWEWCLDAYRPSHRDNSAEETFAATAKVPLRVLRGGGWFQESWQCRSANRNPDLPGNHYDTVGFRVALVSVSGVQ